MPAPDHIAELIFRHLRNELSPGQETELQRWRNASLENESLFQELTDMRNIHGMMKDYYQSKEEVWKKLTEKIPELREGKVKKYNWWKFAAAACLILAVILIAELFLRHPAKKEATPTEFAFDFKNDIPPGSNKGVLTLANGTKFVLESLVAGTFASQGNTRLAKMDSGLLSYTSLSGGIAWEGAFNMLATPKGGQFQVLLPDGSRVWLNAASSLKYPTYFSGDYRQVELTGEAYFEVAKNPSHPFVVKVHPGTEVKVLGTHFNIMAYPDEDWIKTTLLEGKVKIRRSVIATLPSEIELSPGEQAISSVHDMSSRIIKGMDPDEAIAWKNGRIPLKDADIKAIMRNLVRWYDVEVEYRGDIPNRVFEGGIPRNSNLSEVLKVLESYKIHFTLEGKKIIVTP